MLSIDPTQLDGKNLYKILSGSLIPRPITMIATLNENQSLNLAPFAFFNAVSYNPPTLMVSVQRVDGQPKDTARNILRTEEAVFHAVNRENLHLVNETAANLAAEISEMSRAPFTQAGSLSIKTPGVYEAPVRYETVLSHHYPLKVDNQGEITGDVFLMKITHIHISEEIYQDTYVLPEKLQPMSRLAGIHYASLGEVTMLKRPE